MNITAAGAVRGRSNTMNNTGLGPGLTARNASTSLGTRALSPQDDRSFPTDKIPSSLSLSSSSVTLSATEEKPLDNLNKESSSGSSIGDDDIIDDDGNSDDCAVSRSRSSDALESVFTAEVAAMRQSLSDANCALVAAAGEKRDQVSPILILI